MNNELEEIIERFYKERNINRRTVSINEVCYTEDMNLRLVVNFLDKYKEEIIINNIDINIEYNKDYIIMTIYEILKKLVTSLYKKKKIMWILIQRQNNKERYYISKDIEKLLNYINKFNEVKKINEYHFRNIDNIEFIIRICVEV